MTSTQKLIDEAKRLPGSQIEIVSTSSGFQAGTKLKISNASISQSVGYIYVVTETGTAHNFMPAWYKRVPQTMDELTKEAKEVGKRMDEIRLKQEYLTETGQSDFDEKEFKVYGILKELKSKKHGDSDLNMAKAIAQLI